MTLVEPNKLAFDGSGYPPREGLICMQEIGKCTEEHQAIVRKWLKRATLKKSGTSELSTFAGTNKYRVGKCRPALS
ncbi:DUF469 family protein [Salmonella enterica subsp. enterica]|nr:DUF469 family protein [Salmonella enterica subsp. enterica]